MVDAKSADSFLAHVIARNERRHVQRMNSAIG
jgi:hypothetical protein